MMPPETEMDLRTRVVSLEHQATANAQRITTLEQWQRQTEIADARKDEQWKHVDNRFNDLDKKIEKISGVLSKIMWLVITGIMAGVVSFMIKGGFHMP